FLGLKAAANWPGDYHAFLGVGQCVNLVRNEQLMYDFSLSSARNAGEQRAVAELEWIGRPNDQGVYPHGRHKTYKIDENWMAYFGGEIHGQQSSEVIDNWMLDQPCYSGRWQRRWIDGFEFSQWLYDDENIWLADFPSEIRNVSTPLFFLQGRYDF